MPPKREETRTIHAPWWAPHERVVIRRFTRGHEAKRANWITMLQGCMRQSGKEVHIETPFCIWVIKRAMLDLGVVSWTLRDEGGDLLPLTWEGLWALGENNVDFIAKAIAQFNPGPAEPGPPDWGIWIP